MNICVCRFLLAAAILVIALVAWGTSWAKIVIIVGAALLVITSLAYSTCCCRLGRERAAEAPPSGAPPATD